MKPNKKHKKELTPEEKHKLRMEKITNLLFQKKWELDCTVETLGILCDLSTGEVRKILYRHPKDLKFLTVMKICENAGISYLEILETE